MTDLIQRWHTSQRRQPLGRAWVRALTIFFATCAVLALPLGIAGLVNINEQRPVSWNFWDFAFGMIQLYTAETPSWADSPDSEITVPFTYDVAKVIGPLSAAYAIVSTAAVVLGDRWRIVRARSARDHFIVCGGGRAGVALARALATDGTSVLVGQNVASQGISTSLVRRSIPLSGDPRDVVVLRRAGIERAREVFALDDLGDVNAAVAVSAKAASLNRKGSLICFAVIDNPDLQLTLQARLLGRASLSHLEVHLLDRHQLFASAIVRHEVPDPGAPNFVVGQGPTAVALGLAIARSLADARGTSTGGPPLYLGSAFGSDVTLTARRRWPDIDARVVLSPMPSESPGDLPGEDSSFRPPAGGTVYVSEQTDDLTLQTGLSWLNSAQFDVHRVVFCMNAETGLSGAFTPGARGMFEAGDSVVRVYSRSLALSSPHHVRSQALTERLARAMHELYLTQISPSLSGSPAPGVLQDWESLPENLKAPNRDQARDVGRKLAEMNYAVVPDRGTQTVVEFPPAEVEVLAQMEHARWMAERASRGLTPGLRRTDRTHPDLVPWSELTEVAREKDRVFIRGLPRLLLAEGFEIVALPAGARWSPR